jgi:hypothetical protein
LRGAASAGPSAGPAPVSVESFFAHRSQAGPVRVSNVRASRSGRTVTVHFRVNRATKARVVIRDRTGKIVGRSPLRAVHPGHDQAVHVRVVKGARSPVRARVSVQPEAMAP